MFDVGFWELLLIAIVALLVVGPHKLPKLAYEAGIWFGRLQQFIQKTRYEIENELHEYEVKNMLDEHKEELNDITKLAGDVEQDFKRKLVEDFDLKDGKSVSVDSSSRSGNDEHSK